MSEPELPPLPEDIDALLRQERSIPPAAPGLADEVWAGLVAALPASAPSPGASGASAASASSAATGALAGKAVVAIVAFALGGATVAVVDRLVPSPAPVVVVAPPEAAAPVSPSAQPPPPVPEPTALPSSSSPSPPPLRPTPRKPVTAAPPAVVVGDEALRAERAMLDAGRMALARGRFEEALDAVTRHRQTFPRGQLVEERDFLALQVSWALGHAEETRALAQAFRRAHPTSLLLPAVDEVTSQIP